MSLHTDATSRQPDMTIDYGVAEPRARRWWNASRADVQARVDGLLEFLGIALAVLGGPRRLAFALALMLLAGGMGDCLVPARSNAVGPSLMAFGGGLLGFVLPLPRK